MVIIGVSASGTDPRGRLTASQIAWASLPSFLPFFGYGATKRGAINLTWCPNCCRRRAHSCAPEHASSPTMHGGCDITTSSRRARDTVLHSTTAPVASTPCTEKLFFARSIPRVVTLLMTSPFRVG